MSHWRQFQSNGPSQGFAPFSTGPTGSFKWKTEVGPVSFASPVIGDDGTIYIGNLNAELIAVGANGVIKWKKALAERGHTISASCALDNSENIYVITTHGATVRDHRSGHTVPTHIVHQPNLSCVGARSSSARQLRQIDQQKTHGFNGNKRPCNVCGPCIYQRRRRTLFLFARFKCDKK